MEKRDKNISQLSDYMINYQLTELVQFTKTGF